MKKKYQITATIKCILFSDDENLDQDVSDWVYIDEDEGYIENFKLIDYDYKEV